MAPHSFETRDDDGPRRAGCIGSKRVLTILKPLTCHDIALYCTSSPLHYRKELIVKNPQLQGAMEGRDNPAGETIYEPIPVISKPR